MKLEIANLNKTYSNGVQALKDVTLTIPNGLFGLLGPNGAGKSTLMRTIATLQSADNGEIMLDERVNVLEDKHTVRKYLGYLPQEFGVYKNVSAEAMLNQIAILKGIIDKKSREELVQSLLVQTNLYEDRKKKLGGFSGGMKQRFGVAQALIGNPKIIIVDEPTAGLDPAERKRFLNLLSEIGENKVIILSTHIVDDVKDICSNMAIINRGEVKYQGKPVEAIEQIKGKIWRKQVTKAEEEAWVEKLNVVSSKISDGIVDLHIWSEEPMDGFESILPDLEDVYFAVINNYLN
ncbi:MAG: ABC transporter ATP-binding protein [Bacteroidales bacterium]|nr:ABC transporter ATP-binding protein [Bacteroidales bacterium]MBN2819733.1 ABC transporter ATP-binding protein [Bacteroidales bacterium]